MTKRLSVPDIMARKGASPVVVLTAYTAPMARLLDPYVDILLVGDSLGMVIYGMDSTLGVSLEMMIRHGQAVVKTSAQACVVIDLPFGSYQASKEKAYEVSARVMAETGCAAVKLEGGMEMAETVHFLVQRGIPVMGHIGLMPQHVHRMGGYKFQGRDDAAAAVLLQDALAIEQAGAFAIVFEGIQEPVARHIAGQLKKAVSIGIGASPACDGQVLVVDDMLGISQRVPGFVKRYGMLAEQITDAVQAYAGEVRSAAFPSAEYCYPFKKPSA